MKEIQPPTTLKNIKLPILFLGGSIEMGAASEWQKLIVKRLRNYEGTVLNPRRDDWDSRWTQDINHPKFKEQVDWELDAQELSTHIIYYFNPGTKSPITLLDLGLCMNRNVLVCCPPGYWRKGNVDVTCAYYGTRITSSFKDLLKELPGFLTTVAEDEIWKKLSR